MEDNKCKMCNKLFTNKQSLQRHENKKIKCNIKTDYKCNRCNKYFTQKKNLIQHNEKNNCILINTDIQLNVSNKEEHKNALLDILNSKLNNENKIKLIKIINPNLNDMSINDILNNDVSINTKIVLLNTKVAININMHNTNTNSNNIINYNINNFGNENVDYIANKSLLKLIKNNYSEDILLKLSDEIYLNEKHPENQTIKIDNLNNKFCKVKEKNKWITTTKDAALKKIFDRVFDIVINCIDETQDVINEEKINIINGYIEKDFEDEIIVEAVKKLALNIYNFYNSSII